MGRSCASLVRQKRSSRRWVSTLLLALGVCLWQLAGGVQASGNANETKVHDLTRIMSPDDTRHLLARTGIGVSPADYLTYSQLTRQQAIDTLLSEFTTETFTAWPAWVNSPVPHYHARQDMNDNDRAMFNNQRNAELSQLKTWWVGEILQTPSPQTERMVLFWHDLFATSFYGTDRQSLAMARQNQTFRELGMGSWETLLKAMIRDAALLEYLNAGSNHKNSPNENLARELLELFSLGEGNYDEATVKEAARALTGHSTNRLHDLAFDFASWKHDTGTKTLFGVTGNHRGDDLIDRVLAQPSAARFLVERFWQAFVSDTAVDERWQTSMATVFRESGLDIASLYRAVLESDAFWRAEHRGAMIKSPIDIIAGTARSLDYPQRHWRQFAGWQGLLGMELFAPPNVSGWKEGGAFVTPGHLFNRYKLVDRLVNADKGLRNTSTQTADTAMATDADNTDAENRSMDAGGMTMAMAGSSSSRLRVKLAAEDYQGPAEYQVAVFAKHEQLWRSDKRVFEQGQDTERDGLISNPSELNWITESFAPEADLVDRATHITVTFLNDAAGPGGDRNLYVGGIHVGGHWFASSGALQVSECPPELPANAGNLYCAGSVRFNLATPGKNADNALTGGQASAVHVNWANDNGDRQIATLTLDYLSTPAAQLHALRFSIITRPDSYAVLRLDSFGCWPDCIDSWPACAWEDPDFPPNKRLTFPARSASDPFWTSGKGAACQYTALKEQEKALVNTLWQNVGGLLAEVEKTRRAQQFLPVLRTLRANLQANDVNLDETPYASNSVAIRIDPAYAPAGPAVTTLPEIKPQVSTAQQLLDQLQSVPIPVAHLLMPLSSEQASDELPLHEWVRKTAFQLK